MTAPRPGSISRAALPGLRCRGSAARPRRRPRRAARAAAGAAAAPAAASGAAPAADAGAAASAPGRETPDAPFRQLAPPAGPEPTFKPPRAEALQAEERPRGDAGRVPRPSAGRLQPDDQDRRRRQPARSRGPGRSDRAHARRGDQDAQRARHRRPGRVAGRDAVDGQHLGRVERQPVDAEQEPGRGAGPVRRRRREPGLRPQGVRARARQPADRDHAPQGQPADGRQPGVHAPAVRAEAPVRLADGRRRGVDQEADARRSARLLRQVLPPQQRGAAGRRRHDREGAAQPSWRPRSRSGGRSAPPRPSCPRPRAPRRPPASS